MTKKIRSTLRRSILLTLKSHNSTATLMTPSMLPPELCCYDSLTDTQFPKHSTPAPACFSFSSVPTFRPGSACSLTSTSPQSLLFLECDSFVLNTFFLRFRRNSVLNAGVLISWSRSGTRFEKNHTAKKTNACLSAYQNEERNFKGD